MNNRIINQLPYYDATLYSDESLRMVTEKVTNNIGEIAQNICYQDISQKKR